MTPPPERPPGEALDLTTRAVALQRAGLPPVAVSAVVDQALASLRHERNRGVACTLSWVCRVLEGREPRVTDDQVIDAALRVAARELASRRPEPGRP